MNAVERMLKAGNFLFTNKLQAGTNKGDVTLTLKTHAIVLLLGVVEKGAPEPTQNQLKSLCGGVGLVELDDVQEALGDEAMQKLIKHCERKFSK